MKKFTCALLILCLLSTAFLASCGNNDDVDISKPVFGEYEQSASMSK